MDLKDLGAIVGFLSGAVVIYDRYHKGRPTASLTITNGNGDQHRVCIRITNTTTYDVAIIGAAVRPSVYFLSETLEVRDLNSRQLQAPQFLLKPQESRELFVVPRYEHGVALELKPQHVLFLLNWRRGNATWLKQFPVIVCTSTQIVRLYGTQRSL